MRKELRESNRTLKESLLGWDHEHCAQALVSEYVLCGEWIEVLSLSGRGFLTSLSSPWPERQIALRALRHRLLGEMR